MISVKAAKDSRVLSLAKGSMRGLVPWDLYWFSLSTIFMS
jgi:hypothetical protein